jgi:predicted nucleic acid-binding protein
MLGNAVLGNAMHGDAARPLVLDASAAIPLVREDRLSMEASQRLHEAKAEGRQLLVPTLLWLEVMNVLARRYRLGPDAVLEAMVELEAAGIDTIELDRPMLLLALDTVARFGLTAYDAAYMALADAADADLLTADAMLAAAAGDRAQLLGDKPGFREVREAYSADSWSSWPGAASYLRELRNRLQAFP